MSPIIEPNHLNQEVPHQTFPDPAVQMREKAEEIVSNAVETPLVVSALTIDHQPVSIELEGSTFEELKAEIKRVYEKDTLTDEEAIEFGIQLIKDWITYR